MSAQLFEWVERNRRRLMDALAIVLLGVGLTLVVVALVLGELGNLKGGDVVDAGSVLAATGGLLLGLGPHPQ